MLNLKKRSLAIIAIFLLAFISLVTSAQKLGELVEPAEPTEKSSYIRNGSVFYNNDFFSVTVEPERVHEMPAVHDVTILNRHNFSVPFSFAASFDENLSKFEIQSVNKLEGGEVLSKKQEVLSQDKLTSKGERSYDYAHAFVLPAGSENVFRVTYSSSSVQGKWVLKGWSSDESSPELLIDPAWDLTNYTSYVQDGGITYLNFTTNVSAGNNRFLLVCAQIEDSLIEQSQPANVTIDRFNMRLIRNETNNAGYNIRVFCYYALDSELPSTPGLYFVNVTTASTVDEGTAGAIMLTGVNQSVPVGYVNGSNQASGSTISATVSVNNTGDLAFTMVGDGNPATITPGKGFTTWYHRAPDSSTGAGAYNNLTAGWHVLNDTSSSTNRKAMIAFVVQQSFQADDSCAYSGSGPWVISGGDECSISSVTSVDGAFRIAYNSKARILSGGGVRSSGCFFEDGSGAFVEDSGVLPCGQP